MSVHDDQRVDAISVWGPAKPVSETELPDPDDRGFTTVVRIFMRTWPFLRPMMIGYWRDRTVLRGSFWQSARTSDWSYRYVPFVVTPIAMLGPIAGSHPFGIDWGLDVLVYGTLAMAVIAWLLNFTTGRLFAGAAIAAVLVGTSSMLFAIFVVDGWEDDVQVAAVCFACLSMWLFQ